MKIKKTKKAFKNPITRGDIFTKRKTLGDKIANECAWFRAKKHWVFMPRKEYKRNLVFLITGMWTISMALIGIVTFVPYWIYSFVTEMRVKKVNEEMEDFLK